MICLHKKVLQDPAVGYTSSCASSSFISFSKNDAWLRSLELRRRYSMCNKDGSNIMQLFRLWSRQFLKHRRDINFSSHPTLFLELNSLSFHYIFRYQASRAGLRLYYRSQNFSVEMFLSILFFLIDSLFIMYMSLSVALATKL